MKDDTLHLFEEMIKSIKEEEPLVYSFVEDGENREITVGPKTLETVLQEEFIPHGMTPRSLFACLKSYEKSGRGTKYFS